MRGRGIIPPMKRSCVTLLFLSLLTSPSFAVPMATDDPYSPTEDMTFTINAATGVLANDTTDSGSGEAVLQSTVSNGNLLLASDGSFDYVPDADFFGEDSFTYLVREVAGPTQFIIDPANSAVNISATLSTSFGSDTDSDNSALTGTVDVDLDSITAPFSTIQLTDVNATLADAITLNFSFALGLAGVQITGQPGALSVDMVQPGAPASVNVTGNYSQINNELSVAGTVNVTASGLASGQVPEGDQAINVDMIFTDFNGTITQNGSELVLTTPVNFTGDFDVSGNTVTLTLVGNLRATRQVQQLVDSNVATVMLNVRPTPDAPELLVDRYFWASNTEVLIPAVSPVEMFEETLVSTGAVWRFLDDGSDQGLTWIDPGFADGSWTNGPAPLGYGQGNEATVIGFGGDANAKHITAYFRHAFEVADSTLQGALELQLLRDDGAAVYLNGVEVWRNNLAEGAGYLTRASNVTGNESESHFYRTTMPADLLVDGTNVLAVEVHQVSPTSSDLSFDLALIRHRSGGGVLANDSDPDGEVLMAKLHRDAENGSVQVLADGSFRYDPRPGFVGDDQFVYEAIDTNVLVEGELLVWGDDWRYLDNGSDQGTNWVAQAFDDSTWAVGAAELGYGDPDHTTGVNFVDTTPGDPTNVTKNATTYFRRTFVLGNVASITNGLAIQLLRDDAAAVYINGVEVHRDANLPIDAAFDTYATVGVVDENEVISIPFSNTLLQDGTNSIAVEVHQVSPTSTDMAFNLAIVADLLLPTELVSAGASWKWLYDGSNQSNAWQQVIYDDSLWLSGPGKLGYGDGDEVTTLPAGATPRNITAYFRHIFSVPDASMIQALSIDLLRDDGAAVYLNGVEVVRDNLAAGAANTNLAEVAITTDIEGTYLTFDQIDPALLQDGENLLAVEIHQNSAGSSDLAFDLQLNARSERYLELAQIRIFDGGGFLDVDGDAMDDHWEEIHGLDVGSNDAGIDGDGDGASNLHEYLAETLPEDAGSVLAFSSVEQEPSGDISIVFPAVTGKVYQLQFATSVNGPFVDVAGGLRVAAGLEETFVIPEMVGMQKGYWRIALVVTP